MFISGISFRFQSNLIRLQTLVGWDNLKCFDIDTPNVSKCVVHLGFCTVGRCRSPDPDQQTQGFEEIKNPWIVHLKLDFKDGTYWDWERCPCSKEYGVRTKGINCHECVDSLVELIDQALKNPSHLTISSATIKSRLFFHCFYSEIRELIPIIGI